MKINQSCILFLLFIVFGCSQNESSEIKSNSLSDELTGGDTFFPLVENPKFTSVGDSMLSDNDLVGIVSFGSTIKVYPYRYTNHSEVVNDTYRGEKFVFTYCPITKSALAFKTNSKFKASGKLLRDNLVPWDEETETLWSQMYMKGIQGTSKDILLNTIPVIETRWSTVKEYFPNAIVLTNFSITNRYNPPTDNTDNSNDALAPDPGDFVYGILNDFGNIHIFKYTDFRDSHRIDVIIRGEKFIVYGDGGKRIINAFKVDNFDDYEVLENKFPMVLKNKSGTEYSILGVSKNVQTLEKPTYAYVAIWNAWDAFYDSFTFIDVDD
jgi:hypothetical protein